MDSLETPVIYNRQTNSPTLPVLDGPDVVVNSMESVYSMKWIKITEECYMLSVLLEYLCCFGSLPFEEVEHRPSVHYVSTFFLMLTPWVCLCLLLLPISIFTLPTQVAYYSHAASALFQLISMALCIGSTVAILKSKESMVIPIYRNDALVENIDCSLYMKILAAVTLVVVIITLVFSCINTYIYGKALFRIVNRINRKPDPESQAFERIAEELQNCETSMGTKHIMPKEIVKTFRSHFI